MVLLIIYLSVWRVSNICPASDARLCVLHPWYLYLGYSFQSVTNKRYFGTQSLIPFGFNIAEPHLVARPLKKKKKEEKRGKLQNIVLLCNM